MRRASAEVAVIDQERRRQAQQRFDRQERHLPAAVRRAARGHCPELLPCLADRQIKVISQLSHAWRLQPALPHKEPLARADTSVLSIAPPMIGMAAKAAKTPGLEVTQTTPLVGGLSGQFYR